MPKWFDTLKQQREAGRDSITAVASVADIPEDATPEQGWILLLSVRKITARLTVNGQTYYWLLVKDRAGYAFSIVVWDYQWDDLGPFEEGETRELTVRVPKGDYTAWNLV
jgi:hypothetical protein